MLPHFYLPYVGFIHIPDHLHVFKVCNHIEVGHIHARNHCLANFHLSRDNNAVDRGVDFRVVQILGGSHSVGLAFFIRKACHVIVAFRCLEFIVRDQLLVMKFLVAFIVCFGIFIVCFCRSHIGIGAFQFAVEKRFFDFCKQLAFGNVVVVVGIQFVDYAGHLGADIHLCDRLHSAGGCHHLRQ